MSYNEATVLMSYNEAKEVVLSHYDDLDAEMMDRLIAMHMKRGY